MRYKVSTIHTCAFCGCCRYYYPKETRPDSPSDVQGNINQHFECLVAVIDDIVRSLPDISSHVDFLRRLGTMHCDVTIQPRLLELMGPVFCNTVRPLLLVQGKWSYKVGNQTNIQLFLWKTHRYRSSLLGYSCSDTSRVLWVVVTLWKPGQKLLTRGSKWMSHPRLSNHFQLKLVIFYTEQKYRLIHFSCYIKF